MMTVAHNVKLNIFDTPNEPIDRGVPVRFYMRNDVAYSLSPPKGDYVETYGDMFHIVKPKFWREKKLLHFKFIFCAIPFFLFPLTSKTVLS